MPPTFGLYLPTVLPTTNPNPTSFSCATRSASYSSRESPRCWPKRRSSSLRQRQRLPSLFLCPFYPCPPHRSWRRHQWHRLLRQPRSLVLQVRAIVILECRLRISLTTATVCLRTVLLHQSNQLAELQARVLRVSAPAPLAAAARSIVASQCLRTKPRSLRPST